MLWALLGHNKNCKHFMIDENCMCNKLQIDIRLLEVYMKLCYTMSVRQLIVNEVTYQLKFNLKVYEALQSTFKKLLINNAYVTGQCIFKLKLFQVIWYQIFVINTISNCFANQTKASLILLINVYS